MEFMTKTMINKILGSQAILGLLNERCRRYASVTTLQKEAGLYTAVVLLTGTTQPIRITFTEVVIAEDCAWISLGGFAADVVWVQHLLEDFLEGKKFTIPAGYRAVLKPMRALLN